jgi:hypothetical protein
MAALPVSGLTAGQAPQALKLLVNQIKLPLHR